MKQVYKEFLKELEKQAGTPSAIGRGFGKVLEFAWKHPKTTIAAGAAGITIPLITAGIAKHILPSFIIGEEIRKGGVMNKQTKLMQDILEEERKKNQPSMPPVAEPINIPIERPLV